MYSQGLGDMPNETSSARSRKSGQGSRAGSSVRGGSASRYSRMGKYRLDARVPERSSSCIDLAMR